MPRSRPWFGAYVFGDFCLDQLEAVRVRGRPGRRPGPPSASASPSVSSFGQDANGELYVLSLAGGVYRLAPR